MNIFEKRPFKIRNAEEFDLNRILDVFVSPLNEARNPFELENSIIKGAMGSGKSTLLRANYAFHLYSIVPAILNDEQVVLPVTIRLSDFQHHSEPAEVYRAVIIQIVKEISKVYRDLEATERLISIHHGMQSLPKSIFETSKLEDAYSSLLRLEAHEYSKVISDELGLKAGAKPKFLELGSEYRKKTLEEVTSKRQPGIGDVHDAYEYLLRDFNGAILLLIDEAGSLDRSFFKSEQNSSLFETLMNQLRTAEYIRTKIAVYPHSYSDILVETRYGEIIHLTEDVTDNFGYVRFRERVISIISRYIQSESDNGISMFDLFDLNPLPNAYGDPVEQLIYASGGNVRRLLSILDTCMSETYALHGSTGRVGMHEVLAGLRRHSAGAESSYSISDREFLATLAKTCRSRSTYRFRFPYKAPVLAKFVSRSEEHNIVNIAEAGTGRRGTTYEFDYAFCVEHDIPTHHIKDTERIDKDRSLKSGTWIERVTKISEELIEHAQMPGKIEGQIEFLKDESGFAAGNGVSYYISRRNVISADQGKAFMVGKRVRFYPISADGVDIAYDIEVL